MKEIGGFYWPDADRDGAPTILSQVDDIDRVVPHLKRRRTVVQAGGNVGVYPKRLSVLFDRVHTFEPGPENFACLRRNVSEANVFCVNAALGSATGSVALEYCANNVGGHSIRGSGDIPMTTIDALGLPDCDLIWLDIEGYELEALKGATDTIERCKPVVIVEDHGLSQAFGTPVGGAVDWLVDRGYRNAGRLELDNVMVPAREYPNLFVGTTLDRFAPGGDGALPADAREAAFPLLQACLSFSLPMHELSQLRLQLFANPELWNGLCGLAAERDMLSILENRLGLYGLLPPGSRSPAQTGRHPADFFREVREQHAARRAAMRGHLSDAIAALNRIGIEPLLLKGAVSLWKDHPRWRQMRDIDLLVDAGRAEDAQSALRALGFDTQPSAGSSHTTQHLAPLYRDGLPGWLELHIATASRRGSDRLPSRELEQLSIRSERDGFSARLLPAAYDVLHGLAHNHFSHRSSSLGTVNLKGLYEFAAAVNAAEPSDHEQMHDRATRDARLLGAFDFWVAAAARFYRFAPPAGWSIAPDADARAARVLSRMACGEMGSTLTVFREEVGLALGRVQQTAKAGHRMRTRANILNSAIREIVVPWRDRADLHRDSAGIRGSR